MSLSARNQLNYNSNFIGQKEKAGSFYNGNYSIDYSILKNLKVEIAGYYLAQFNEDKFKGDSHYYQDHFNLVSTKEKVFGYGPGLGYFASNGALIEGKLFFKAVQKTDLRVPVPPYA